MNKQFEQGESFQLGVLFHLYRNVKFSRKIARHLKPEYFTDSALQALSHVGTSYVLKYGKCPANSEEASIHAKHVGYSELEYGPMLQELLSMDAPGQVVAEEALLWCKRAAIELSVAECSYMLSQEEDGALSDEIVHTMRASLSSAFSAGVDNGIGIELFDNIDAVLDTASRRGAISTGIQGLDRALGGGLSGGEFGLIMGRFGSGKSSLACNIAAGAAITGHDVVHYTLEMPENQVGMYYAQLLSGMTKEELKDPNLLGKAKSKLLKISKLYRSRIFIRSLLAKHATWEDIRLDIDRRVNENGRAPAVMIVDSPYLLKTSGKMERYEGIQDSVVGCRSVCQEYNMCGWGMSQANRSGASAETETLTGFHMAESFQQQFDVDVCMSLSSTSGERERGEARIHLIKNREFASGFDVKVKVDLSRRRFTDMEA